MPSRKTLPAVAVPQTREDAERLAARIGDLMRETERKALDAAGRMAALKLELKTATADAEREIRAGMMALATFATAHRDELLPKDRKSVALAAGTIGWRTGMPKLVVEDEADLVARLRAMGREHLVVVEESVAKDAFLREREELTGLPGVTVTQEERFFFHPLDVETDVAVKVPAAAPGKAA
jgi:phage host-nuclease inhibitor protein Gam